MPDLIFRGHPFNVLNNEPACSLLVAGCDSGNIVFQGSNDEAVQSLRQYHLTITPDISFRLFINTCKWLSLIPRDIIGFKVNILDSEGVAREVEGTVNAGHVEQINYSLHEKCTIIIPNSIDAIAWSKYGHLQIRKLSGYGEFVGVIGIQQPSLEEIISLAESVNGLAWDVGPALADVARSDIDHDTLFGSFKRIF